MSVAKRKIEHFTASIRKSLMDKNYYAALSMALMLPDICSKLEFPEEYTKNRYPNWFNKYIGTEYISYVGPERKKHVFLSGKDAYALRCSFLHQGELDITKQKSREHLEGFTFLEPLNSKVIHNNQINNILQLQVDIFCEDICRGVEKWLQANKDNEYVNIGAASIMEINKTFRF